MLGCPCPLCLPEPSNLVDEHLWLDKHPACQALPAAPFIPRRCHRIPVTGEGSLSISDLHLAPKLILLFQDPTLWGSMVSEAHCPSPESPDMPVCHNTQPSLSPGSASPSHWSPQEARTAPASFTAMIWCPAQGVVHSLPPGCRALLQHP